MYSSTYNDVQVANVDELLARLKQAGVTGKRA